MTWTETLGAHRPSDEIVIAIEGEDGRVWWNGQTTNDLDALAPGGSVYGLALTPKGRILADVLTFDRGGALHFSTDRGAWPALREQLEKYIIMEDVTLRETSLGMITLAGRRAGELDLAPLVGELSGSVVATSRLGPTRDLVAEEAALAELWPRIVAAVRAAGGVEVSREAWDAARIAEGIPRFGVDFGDKTYPQEAGLKARAVSFRKGCYLGQEVVCMLENRGQLSRSLVRIAVPAGTPRGAAVRRGTDVVGEVTSAAGMDGLGLLKRALATPGTKLESEGGPIEVIAVVE